MTTTSAAKIKKNNHQLHNETYWECEDAVTNLVSAASWKSTQKRKTEKDKILKKEEMKKDRQA